MKVTLEQLAEKVDDLTSVINKLKGIIGFLAWVGGIVAVIYSMWK